MIGDWWLVVWLRGRIVFFVGGGWKLGVGGKGEKNELGIIISAVKL